MEVAEASSFIIEVFWGLFADHVGRCIWHFPWVYRQPCASSAYSRAVHDFYVEKAFHGYWLIILTVIAGNNNSSFTISYGPVVLLGLTSLIESWQMGQLRKMSTGYSCILFHLWTVSLMAEVRLSSWLFCFLHLLCVWREHEGVDLRNIHGSINRAKKNA